MLKKIKRLIREEEGQALVFVALFMVVLLGIAALVVDVGMMQVSKSKLQNAADAAALAGASELPNTAAAKAEARSYAEANGVDAADITVNTPYAGDPDKIEVICSENVRFSFARVLGFSDEDIPARAVAERSGLGGGAFGYAIFSGSPDHKLELSGNGDIVGSVHTNSNASMSGNGDIDGSFGVVKNFSISGNSKITGQVTAEKITMSGNSDIGSIVENPAPVISMPQDFSDEIKQQAEAVSPMVVGDVTISGNETRSTPIHIKGNLKISGNSTLTFTSPIFVEGNITISGNYSYGGSCIFATGSITLSGNNDFPNSKTLIYSQNSNITISGNAKPNGIIFAPKGKATISGNAVHGRVIADRVVFSGNYDVTSGANDLDILPKLRVRLVE